MINTTKQLQGIGNVPAKLAKDFKIGEKTIWNYGYIETILNIEYTKSGKSLKWIIDTNGKKSVRILRVNTLVGIAY